MITAAKSTVELVKDDGDGYSFNTHSTFRTTFTKFTPGNYILTSSNLEKSLKTRFFEFQELSSMK